MCAVSTLLTPTRRADTRAVCYVGEQAISHSALALADLPARTCVRMCAASSWCVLVQEKEACSPVFST